MQLRRLACMVVASALGANGLPLAQDPTANVQRTAPTTLVEPGPSDGPQSPFQVLGKQWQNPSDLSSVLMIIGGDIVQKAIAQLRGRYIAPIAFSFGFVSYSFISLLSAIGDGRLMPVSDCPSMLTNLSSGYTRTNHSWILGRLLRDAEKSASPTNASLHVSIYRTTGAGGKPTKDRLWWSGAAVIPVQLGIACVPLVMDGDSLILILTAVGTVLALAGSALPQWAEEKWAARTGSKGQYCLTRGNGHQHAVVIMNEHPKSLNLEDLATSRGHPVHHTRLVSGILAVCWIAFLLCVAGLQSNTWYLLGIGLLGMVQNVFAAGAPRDPNAMGLPMEKIREICQGRVMEVLKETENEYATVGAALVPIFFPGELREDEKEFFENAKARAKKASKDETHGRNPSLPVSASSSGTLTEK